MRRGQKSLNAFKFDTSRGRFPSDGSASMAVKGLIVIMHFLGAVFCCCFRMELVARYVKVKKKGMKYSRNKLAR